MIHHLIFFLMCILCGSVYATPLSIDTVDAYYKERGITSLSIRHITFQADVPFERSEILYIIGFDEQSQVTLQDIQQAHARLLRTNRFDTVRYLITEKEPDTYHLHIILSAHWLLKKVIIRGVVFGSHRYTNLYLQQPGEIFDVSLHEASIQSLRKLLLQDGYFSSTVNDELVYNHALKTITTKIEISKGKRFAIDRVDIVVRGGLPAEKQSMLEKLIKDKIWNESSRIRYSHDLLLKKRDKIRLILKNNGFYEQQIRFKRRIDPFKKKIDLIFCIRLQKQRKFVFEGNRFFSSKRLVEDIIGEHQPSWLLDPKIIAEKIVRAYYQKGYKNVRVLCKKNNETITFIISEGKPVLINNVIIKDDGIVTHEYERYFQELESKELLDEDTLHNALHNLKSDIQGKGYWECSFDTLEYVRHTNGSYDVIIGLTKGVCRYLKHLRIDFSDKGLLGEDIAKRFEKDYGQYPVPCSPHFLSDHKGALLSYLHEQGYWYADIRPEIMLSSSYDSKKKIILVDVLWYIEPGKQVAFGKIFVKGITRLNPAKVRSELLIEEGSAWNKQKIELARSRLKRLNIFKHIQFQPHSLSQKDYVKDLLVVLHDDNQFEVRLRSGYFLTSKNFLFKRASTYKIGGSFIVKNPTNTADIFELAGDITRFERYINFDYQRPHFFGLPLLGKVKGYTNKYIHPIQIGRSEAAYEAEQHGLLFGLSSEYKNNYYWGLSCGNEWLSTSRVRGNLKLAPDLINRVLPYFFIEPSLVVSAVDDKVNPTQGGLTFVSCKLMIPEKNGSFSYRIMIEQALFYPLYHRIIGAARIRWGHIFRRSFDHIMPIERFYLGGPHSVRGYQKDALPPLGVEEFVAEDGSLHEAFTIQGGSSMLNLNFELRCNLFDNFGIVLFHDIGVLSQHGFSPLHGEWLPTSGIGFRYQTPIGPIRFDIGRKWKRSFPAQARYEWYLTIGHMF